MEVVSGRKSGDSVALGVSWLQAGCLPGEGIFMDGLRGRLSGNCLDGGRMLGEWIEGGGMLGEWIEGGRMLGEWIEGGGMESGGLDTVRGREDWTDGGEEEVDCTAGGSR